MYTTATACCEFSLGLVIGSARGRRSPPARRYGTGDETGGMLTWGGHFHDVLGAGAAHALERASSARGPRTVLKWCRRA